MVQTKLCIVTHTFLPHVGGIERVVYEQSKRLLQKKFDLKVLTNRIDTERHYSYDGITVRCYDSLSIGFRLGIPYPVLNVTSYKPFLELIKSSDLIHAHGHPYLSSLLAARLAKKYSKPFVLTQHNTFIEYGHFWDTIEKTNDIIVGKAVLKKADKIVVVSNATMRYVSNLGADPSKIELLYNGVDLNRFKPLTGVKDEVRKRLQIPKKAIVVITVRRLVYKNGIDTLINSAEIAIKKNQNIIFLVVGGGPDYAEVKSRVEQLGMGKNFKLAGFVSDGDLPFYYNSADFFVLPSKSGEGLPLVALEAMACGLPVIATNVGGISEIIKNQNGTIVPPDDPIALAAVILEYSRRELFAFKDALRAMVAQEHSWDRNVTKLVEIYKELI